MQGDPIVTFEPAGLRVRVSRNTTVLQAILENGLEVSHTCGGHCTCGSCLVVIAHGGKSLSPAQIGESGHLTGRATRLACQSKIRGDVTVRLPVGPAR